MVVISLSRLSRRQSQSLRIGVSCSFKTLVQNDSQTDARRHVHKIAMTPSYDTVGGPIHVTTRLCCDVWEPLNSHKHI